MFIKTTKHIPVITQEQQVHIVQIQQQRNYKLHVQQTRFVQMEVVQQVVPKTLNRDAMETTYTGMTLVVIKVI